MFDSLVSFSSARFSLAQARVYYQWARLEQLDQWWHYLLVLAVIVLVLTYVVWWYRRDTVEQQQPVRWAMLILRVVAFVGLILYFFQLDKRSELKVTRNSRVAILVDTSLSMTLPGTPGPSGVVSGQSRADEASNLLAASPLLQDLSSQHDVTVYRFDQLTRPVQVAALARPQSSSSSPQSQPDDQLALLSRAHTFLLVACGMGAVALVLILISFAGQLAGARSWSGGAWSLLSGSTLALAGMLVLAFAILPASDYPIEALFLDPNEALSKYQAPEEDWNAPVISQASTGSPDGKEIKSTELPADWRAALTPSGIETRMGDAIKAVLEREQGSPLAGVVVVTDGRSNAGLDPRSVILAAQNARVPLYFVGVGSEKNPPNMKIVEVDAPRRIYPGDKFSMNVLVQSNGFAGKPVSVQVLAGPKGADPSTFAIEEEQSVNIGTDDELVTATFELDPKAVGVWSYFVKLIPLSGDVDATDNSGTAEVAVIERKNRVLIFAGGPTREYQFVRNLMFRDRDVESHVLLQTGAPAFPKKLKRY